MDMSGHYDEGYPTYHPGTGAAGIQGWAHQVSETALDDAVNERPRSSSKSSAAEAGLYATNGIPVAYHTYPTTQTSYTATLSTARSQTSSMHTGKRPNQAAFAGRNEGRITRWRKMLFDRLTKQSANRPMYSSSKRQDYESIYDGSRRSYQPSLSSSRSSGVLDENNERLYFRKDNSAHWSCQHENEAYLWTPGRNSSRGRPRSRNSGSPQVLSEETRPVFVAPMREGKRHAKGSTGLATDPNRPVQPPQAPHVNTTPPPAPSRYSASQGPAIGTDRLSRGRGSPVTASHDRTTRRTRPNVTPVMSARPAEISPPDYVDAQSTGKAANVVGKGKGRQLSLAGFRVDGGQMKCNFFLQHPIAVSVI